MKKKGRWIPVIGCLMLVLFLAGCGKMIDIQSTAEQEIPSTGGKRQTHYNIRTRV